MARGTQHLKKRSKAAAATAVEPKRRSRAETRRVRRIEESGMFFPMLRRQAKWVFVLLALVFAGGFIFFGVGSGSNGLGNVLQNWLNIGNGSAPSISKLEATTKKHPGDAQAYRDLASAYEAKQQTDKAIPVLERYVSLRPKDTSALQELAGLYEQRLTALSGQYSSISAATVADASSFQPPATTKLGQAYQALLPDPITQAVDGYVQQQQTKIADEAGTVAKKEEQTYQTLAKIDPTDPATQFQLAQAAQNAGDAATAIAAYKRAAKIDPSTYGSAAKQALKQLQPAPPTTTPKAKSKAGASAKKSK